MEHLIPHVELEDHGTVILVRPLSDEARTWVDDNVEIEGWQWWGDAFACEPRAAYSLIDAMAEAL